MKNSNLKEFNRFLNNAITYVICAKFKKDAINAFEAVTAAGYKIEKRNGAFVVFNPKTHKYIYISAGSKYSYDNLVLDSEFNYYTIRVNDATYAEKYGVGVLSLFDFVGFLETPSRNYDVIKRQREDAKAISNTRRKYEVIKNAIWSIEYEKTRLKEIQAKINQLQQELIYHSGEKARCEIELKEIRKNYGLKV